MTERRALTDGLKPPPDPAAEKRFVFGGPPTPPRSVAPTIAAPPARAPLSTRIRADYAAALKRASLTRQLSGEFPSSVQEMLEEALGPWLEDRGYLS